MNQEEKQALVDGLKKMAAFLEVTEFVDDSAYFSNPEVYLFCPDAESFLKNVKVIGGFKREFNEYSASCIKKFGDVKFTLHCSREAVCERIEDGVQIIPATSEKIIPAQPERVVPKYKYKCPESLLGKEVGTPS